MANISGEWQVPCPVQLVWDVITDQTRTAWRSDLKSLEPQEPGCYIEITKDGVASRVTVIASEPCRRYAVQVDGRDTCGIRELLLTWDGTQTHITINNEVMGRTLFLGLMEKLYLKEFQKRYLRDLNNELHRIVHGGTEHGA